MQARRQLKLAVFCTLALAIPGSAATSGVLAQDGPPAKHAKIYRDVCPINNPDYTGPKPLPR
jgi:hypothetical protein